MKSRLKIPVLLGVLGTLALTGCAHNNDTPPTIELGVSDAHQIVVKDYELDGYDFSSLFVIKVDGAAITVNPEYIDASDVKQAAGTYKVVCTYGDHTETVELTVVATKRILAFVQSVNDGQITLLRSQVEAYDFKSLFKATEDGKAVQITDDMVQSTVQAKAGSYTYKVTYGGADLTLAVIVRDDVLVVPAYRTAELTASDLDGFDYTKLFSLYVENKAIKVTADMIDATAATTEVGKSFDVSFSYTHKGTAYASKVTVKVVSEAQYVVSTKDAETYPHAENIDLTTLFEIKKDGKTVPVTADMISGEIDYDIEDGEDEKVSVITLTLNGQKYTASVTVKSGAVIGYKRGEKVVVTKGTDKASYPFAGDFSVTVDGVRFYAIPEAYLVGLDELDFDTVGSYEVTLRLPYSNTVPSYGSGGLQVDWQYVEKTITYVVSEYDSKVGVYREHVVLSAGTQSYNPFNNLSVVVNGRMMNLTTVKENVSVITCYAEIKSKAIDFSSAATQPVVVDVYANGVDGDPITVEFDVTIDSGITVTAKDAGVFAGTTLYTADLFTIVKNGEPVEVTYDMITGKVDTFTPGKYEITANYEGVTATATVTVFQNGMQGTYQTTLTTIPEEEEDDDDDSESGWGGDDDDWYADGYSLTAASDTEASRAAVMTLGNMVIGTDGSMVVNGNKAEIIGGVDESTLRVKFATNTYTMYYDNGIVVLDPDNSLKLGFSDYRRPLIYFNTDTWTIESKLEINYSTSYVLANTFSGYSIDAVKLKNKADGSTMWYGLKVHLVEKTSADTLYRVSWGEVKLADDFVQREGVVASCTFDGEVYSFTMTSNSVAKINKDTTGTALRGTYRGTVNGADARLTVTNVGGVTLTVDGVTVASYAVNDFGNYRNSYIDDANKTIFIYKFSDDGNIKAYSYKFVVNPQANTFELVNKDLYFGRYEADGMFIYLDGYGTGAVNFNSSMFASTQIRYTVTGSELSIRFVNTSPSFTYGDGAQFYVGEFLNTLTVKTSDSAVFENKTFTNAIITDGALVEVSTNIVGRGSLGRSDLLSAIKIVTKDGELTGSVKESAIDTSTVTFTEAGFYRYAINLSVAGKEVTAYYSVQVLGAPSAVDETVYTALGAGVMNGTAVISLDKFGGAVITAAGAKYEGTATAIADGKFIIKAYAANGTNIVATCEKVADGILAVTTTGATSGFDYFTTGSNRVCGTTGLAIREFTVGSQKTYIVSAAATVKGEVAIVTFESGSGDADSVMVITTSSGTKRVQIIAWGKTTDGIIVL